MIRRRRRKINNNNNVFKLPRAHHPRVQKQREVGLNKASNVVIRHSSKPRIFIG